MLIETQIEKKLIESLTQEDSQWTYRPDLRTEEDLWKNFKKILENNNRDKLNGEPLSDTEFLRVKNQVVSTSFYDAGMKLQGENGVFYVKIERENKPVILTVFDSHMKTGGSSVYEIINQYNAFADSEESSINKNRRFDLSFLFNGLPLIHMELKNGKNASYLEAFYQIQKYIREGHFKGIFSLVQMFIVSNEVQTKYIAANENMNKEFLTSWTDESDPDKSVSDLFEFSKKVLRIPEAHEMVSDYCQLEALDRKLILLRPYQIQAIKAIRRAYQQQQSGYIWHTTGSGKTLTSYKASRNMLLDIPMLDKTLFLIDRRDLDEKTNTDFKSYADNDSVVLSGTESTTDLEKKLKSDRREMIVTTIQKLQTLCRRMASGDIKDPDIKKITSKHIAFVVDECHRTITKETQNSLNETFRNHMWYGFTGTPIFSQNIGSLDATTEELYGKPLHTYTIKNALHDKSVLGFQVERKGPGNLQEDEHGNNINEDFSVYDSKEHMLGVLNIILNKSSEKLGFENGSGKTYEAILTVGSIARAQKYYELLMSVKRGNETLKIDEKIQKRYPDFPKVAVTYSLIENQEDSCANRSKMAVAVADYNQMFKTNFTVENINDYNDNLTERFSRKKPEYISRTEQLDLVIVADRLLTGFDAPSLSTIFIDRQPMAPHKLIQAFSRTNRLFDKNKKYGYVVTFQSPGSYKNAIDNALELFTSGGSGVVISPEFDEVEKQFREAMTKFRLIAPTPDDCAGFAAEDSKKKRFCYAFQKFDALYAQIKGYIEWDDKDLERDYNLSLDDYKKYVGWYLNFMDEIKDPATPDDGDSPGDPKPEIDYVLQSYGKEIIDYLYILRLIQAHTREDFSNVDDNKQKEKIEEIENLISSIEKQTPKVGQQLRLLWNSVKEDPSSYKDKDVVLIFENMKEQAINEALHKVSDEMCLNYDDVKYSSEQYMEVHENNIPYFNQIKSNANIAEYNKKTGNPVNRLSYFNVVKDRLKKVFVEDVIPYRIDE